ncbi:MAG: hypothetical protein IK990_01270 [Ruminiclostridium sp.]|nr:hypothetical protein [Ruminiclostridium sp.]
MKRIIADIRVLFRRIENPDKAETICACITGGETADVNGGNTLSDILNSDISVL